MSIFRRLMMKRGGGTPPPIESSKLYIKKNDVVTEYNVQETDSSILTILNNLGLTTVTLSGYDNSSFGTLGIQELTYIGTIPLILDVCFYGYSHGEQKSPASYEDDANITKIDFENGNISSMPGGGSYGSFPPFGYGGVTGGAPRNLKYLALSKKDFTLSISKANLEILKKTSGTTVTFDAFASADETIIY